MFIKKITKNITGNILYLFIGIQFVLFAFLASFIRALSKPNYTVSVSFNLIYTLAVVAFITIILLVYYKFSGIRTKNKIVAMLPYLIFALLQLYILFFVADDGGVNGDAKQVRMLAMQFVQGDYSSFLPTHYLSSYPNNIGLTLFYAFFFMVLPQSYYIIRVLNIIFNLLTMYFTVKIFCLAFPDKQKYVLPFKFFMSLFIPVIILITYTYGDVPSIFFSTASIYFAIKYVKTRKFSACVIACGLIAFAYFIKQTALLIGVAIAIFWIYQFVFKNKALRIKTITAIVAVALFFGMQVSAIDLILRGAGYYKEPINTYAQPVTRWIRMGIPDTKQYGYWDHGRITAIYHQLNGDKAKLNNVLTEEIKVTLTKKPPQVLLKRYLIKNYWLWTEGTFESNKAGLNKSANGEYFYHSASISDNKQATFIDILTTVMKAQYIIMMFFSGIYFLSKKKNKHDEKLLFVLILIFFYGFYTIWEIKARYLLPIYPILFLTSFEMFFTFYESFKEKHARKKELTAELTVNKKSVSI